MIATYCLQNIDELELLILKLESSLYSKRIDILDSTIGQHIRHVLEFYICLAAGSDQGVVNYDERKRDHKIETEPFFAGQIIRELKSWFRTVGKDHEITLNVAYDDDYFIPSSLYRELSYCLEHSIHHQALIRIGLTVIGRQDLVDPNFGVSPATIRNRA